MGAPENGQRSRGLQSRERVLRVRNALTVKIRTTSYLPDINVWLALSWALHPHSRKAWQWLRSATVVAEDPDLVLFCRITQLGLLRLLSTPAVMGGSAVTIGEAWKTYRRWLDHPGVDFFREPRDIDDLYEAATAPFSRQSAPKVLGDCYLLALSEAAEATLVTFDAALAALARGRKRPVVVPD